jgi:hypothetical protein
MQRTYGFFKEPFILCAYRVNRKDDTCGGDTPYPVLTEMREKATYTAYTKDEKPS